MVEDSDGVSAAKLMQDRHQMKEPIAVQDDGLPQLNISSNKPMLCFVNQCRIPIGNSEPYVIVVAGGAIFAHMRCLGMNISGKFGDPHYLTHVRGRLEDVMRGKR